MECKESPEWKGSLLPEGKTWKLVWHDEFEGTEIDESKWSYRLHLMGQRHQTFTDHGAARLDGHSNLRLELIERDGHYYSSQLQTGENFMDRAGKDFCFEQGKFCWPIADITKPKFMHKYGFYEIRCKLPEQPGWWAAFWLQSPCIGSTLDPAESGVEVDIMENFTRDGVISHNNHWNGYGKDHRCFESGARKLKETADGFHVFGLEWNPEGYTYYVDGCVSCHCSGPVSHREQFLLVSAECMGYRAGDQPDPRLKQAVLPDAFIVDYVRVFDEVK